MAYTKQLEPEKLKTISEQLGKLIGQFARTEFKIDKAEIAESFERYIIPGESIRNGEVRKSGLSSIAQRTGSWHHQITSYGKPIGIAHSARSGSINGEWNVQGMFWSPQADKVGRAIAAIDAEIADDEVEVFLATIPLYDIDCFLLK